MIGKEISISFDDSERGANLVGKVVEGVEVGHEVLLLVELLKLLHHDCKGKLLIFPLQILNNS